MMKKLIIALVLLLIAGCSVETKSTIAEIKNDNNLGKSFFVEGELVNIALDNYKIGYFTIRDETGELGLKGKFGDIYQGPRFYVNANGILEKNENEYYLDVKEYSVREI